MAKKKVKKARKEIVKCRRGGVPNWLYMTMSLIIPIYGFICYVSLKETDKSRANYEKDKCNNICNDTCKLLASTKHCP